MLPNTKLLAYLTSQFHEKSMSENEKSMKNSSPTFQSSQGLWYQNNRLDLTVNKFLTVCKTQHRTKRYLRIWEEKKPEKL